MDKIKKTIGSLIMFVPAIFFITVIVIGAALMILTEGILWLLGLRKATFGERDSLVKIFRRE